MDLFVEFRGISWSIGGDSELKKHITLPNILKRYNPSLKGYATGVAPPLISVPWEHLDVAVSGATAYGLLDQAKVNKQDFLQVFQGSRIEKMDYFKNLN